MMHFFRKTSVGLCILLISFTLNAQKQEITLEDIWLKGAYWPESFEGFNWMQNDKYYSGFEMSEGTGLSIVRYEVSSGKQAGVLLEQKDFRYNGDTLQPDNYSFSPDESFLLLETNHQPIYRRSSKAIFYLIDLKTKKVKQVSPQPVSYPTFSPDGKKLAYVRENNLYVYNIADEKEKAVTTDGAVNSIINGSTDWVYEEEFEFTRAFFWSEDGSKLAYYRFDESQVKEYNLQIWQGLYPVDRRYKYPKAGEKNSVIGIYLYDLASGKKQEVDLGAEKDIYIPRVKWTKGKALAVMRMNRLQNHLEILLAEFDKKTTRTIYEEKNNSYIEINDALYFLKDGKHFVLTSEKDGYRHIYLYDMEGKQVQQLTKGNWEVDKFLGVDEVKNFVYYTSTEDSPLERYLYSTDIQGTNKKKVISGKGTHKVDASPQFTYFVDEFSTANSPGETSLYDRTGKKVKVLVENKELKNKLAQVQTSEITFFTFNTENNIPLNAFMIKPANFDASKKYPVLLTVYGGPGFQTVENSWQDLNYFWYQMLAQKGVIIVSVDNRGTGGRGAEFKKMTQNQLGRYEVEDYINTAKHLSSLPFVDKQRIGIFGWSYGGYMSSLAITLGADFFKTAIAVAPVTNWRFYDSIYTERYLGLPSQNAAGYDNYSPLSHADKLKGNYLLIHGTADDNVHVQNALFMQNALIKANKQFESFYYPNRNHGIYGGNTRYHLYKLMTYFLERTL